MESRLKERLTGAAILVALIVLLVPEMFRGQRTDEAAPTSSGEGPPIRSYTIDLSNNPSSHQPLQPTSAAPHAGTEPAVATAAATPAVPAAPTAPSGAASPLNGTAPHPVPVPMSEPVAATATRPSPAPSPAPSPPAPSRPAAGGWSVQLGLFAQHENAERLMRSAQSKGFDATLTDRDARNLYHVQIGHLKDRGTAVALQGRLREQGFAAAVVGPH